MFQYSNKTYFLLMMKLKSMTEGAYMPVEEKKKKSNTFLNTTITVIIPILASIIINICYEEVFQNPKKLISYQEKKISELKYERETIISTMMEELKIIKVIVNDIYDLAVGDKYIHNNDIEKLDSIKSNISTNLYSYSKNQLFTDINNLDFISGDSNEHLEFRKKLINYYNHIKQQHESYQKDYINKEIEISLEVTNKFGLEEDLELKGNSKFKYFITKRGRSSFLLACILIIILSNVIKIVNRRKNK